MRSRCNLIAQKALYLPCGIPSRSFHASSFTLAKQQPKRGAYKKVNAADINAFSSMLSSPTSILTTLDSDAAKGVSEDELQLYNQDWMTKYAGHATVVLKPKSTKEVSAIVAYCYKEGIAICPQGGNTGLVGGSVPLYDEVIVNLGGLDKIRSFDEVSGILEADAGCILQTLDEHLATKGHIMPLDLGAKGSCQIGGNVATNAGGLRLLRYGSLHGTVLGLEVVLPDEKGTVLSVGMNGLRKDNTGYDLKQLFIGSEGTLGLITGVSIITPKRSSATSVALLAVPNWNQVQETFKATRAHLGEILSAFEFCDQEAFKLSLHHQGGKSPIAEPEGDSRTFYVLLETSGSNKDHDDEKLGGLLEHLLESETVSDGVLADNETQLQSLWALREGIAEAAGKAGKVYKYDLSIPVKEMYDLVEVLRERFREKGLYEDGSIKEVVGYGHLGDGNIHVNVVANKFDPKVEEAIEPWIYEWVASRRGSISAEHGLGLMKAPYISYSQEESSIEVMRKIKAMFDPKSILNPYKYFLPLSEAPKNSGYNTEEPGH